MKKSLIVISTLLFSLTIIYACNKEKVEAKTDIPAQQAAALPKAPDFTLNDLNGKNFRLSDHLGKVTIVDFWATWCPPCRMEIPDFQSLHEKYEKSGFLVVGVSLDESSQTVKDFAKKYKLTYPIVMGNEAVSTSYGGIRGIPTTFVIDGKGQIYKKYIGYTEGKIFEQDVLALLKR